LCAPCGNCGNGRVPGEVLEEASAERYQMLSKKSKLRYQNELEKFTSEWKPVSERQWAETDERKWTERKGNLHRLVTIDTDSLSGRYRIKYFEKCIELSKTFKFK
jgi:hypothetical protein